MESYVFNDKRVSIPARLGFALEDMVGGVKGVSLWYTLAKQDIKQRYRRSVLGPFWLTITSAVFVTALGFLYSELFNQSVMEYLPYVAVGYIVWSFISSIVLESCNVYIEAEGMIKQVRQPFSIYICRMVFRNLIVFAHNAVILLVVVISIGNKDIVQLLSIIPAILLLSIAGLFLGMIFGLLCTRFRDIIPIVGSVVQITFFLTPIFWKADILTSRAWVVDINPAYHLIHIVRSPLLGNGVPVVSWQAAIMITLVLGALAIALHTFFRHRIAYWIG